MQDWVNAQLTTLCMNTVEESPKRRFSCMRRCLHGCQGHWVKTAVIQVCLRDGKIWSSHMKRPLLAQEEVLSNSTGYYYRRLLNQSLKNTQTVFSQQRHARI